VGKNPAFQFYPSDWVRDLEEHPLEIEGAWIRICCKLWWSETRGSLTKNIDQWAKILRSYQQDAERILNYIGNERIGDVITDANGNITVKSRRMIRDEKDRENNTLRQRRFQDKKKYNASITEQSQRSSSSSSSTSVQKTKAKKEKIELVDNCFKTIPDALMNKWREVAPGINIPDEIKKAELWLLAHPQKRRSRYDSFLSNWMVKAQDYFIKHGGGGNGTSVRNDARPWLRRPGEELSSDAQQAIADAKQAEREAIARRSANRATKDA